MERINDDTITLTSAEADMIAAFIFESLYRDWDRHTDHYICINVTLDDGMKRMDPQMYEFMQRLRAL